MFDFNWILSPLWLYIVQFRGAFCPCFYLSVAAAFLADRVGAWVQGAAGQGRWGNKGVSESGRGYPPPHRNKQKDLT